MSFAVQEPYNEWHRLATVSSVVDAVMPYVSGLIQLEIEDLPEWLTGLGVPAGWHLARLDGGGVQPSRIAVCSRQAQGSGESCETISMFKFTGMPPADVVRDNADCTLRDLDADGISTAILATPAIPGVIAVRSSGYFSTGGLSVWAQYSSYVSGSHLSGEGRLIQHSVFVESRYQAALSDDITQLSNTIHHAFLTAIETGGS